MLPPEDYKSHIVISADLQGVAQRLQNELKPSRVVKFMEENFKIEHAKAVVAEAYISESQKKYIILGAVEFTSAAQNSLLKLLEEPPDNIEFIIISPTKSNLLPTVRSRLPIVKTKHRRTDKEIPLRLARIDYAQVFAFLKEHARVKKSEAKELVEAIFYKATVTEMLILTKTQMDNFDKAYRLLELNARPQSVLAMLIMGFGSEK